MLGYRTAKPRRTRSWPQASNRSVQAPVGPPWTRTTRGSLGAGRDAFRLEKGGLDLRLVEARVTNDLGLDELDRVPGFVEAGGFFRPARSRGNPELGCEDRPFADERQPFLPLDERPDREIGRPAGTPRLAVEAELIEGGPEAGRGQKEEVFAILPNE